MRLILFHLTASPLFFRKEATKNENPNVSSYFWLKAEKNVVNLETNKQKTNKFMYCRDSKFMYCKRST